MKFYKQALLCLIVTALGGGQASAQWGGGFGGFGYAGYGGYYGSYIQPFVAAPPYFALHPPVYYGKRYTRPYGESPFAAPPGLQTNPRFAPAPHAERSLSFSNPYLPACAEPQYAPQFAPELVPQATPLDRPNGERPSLDNPSAVPSVAPEQTQTPTGSPVVRHRSTQPLEIDNPYFQIPPALATRKGN